MVSHERTARHTTLSLYLAQLILLTSATDLPWSVHALTGGGGGGGESTVWSLSSNSNNEDLDEAYGVPIAHASPGTVEWCQEGQESNGEIDASPQEGPWSGGLPAKPHYDLALSSTTSSSSSTSAAAAASPSPQTRSSSPAVECIGYELTQTPSFSHACLRWGTALCREDPFARGIWKFGIDRNDRYVKLWNPRGEVVWMDFEGTEELCMGEEHGTENKFGFGNLGGGAGGGGGKQEQQHVPMFLSDERPYLTITRSHNLVGDAMAHGSSSPNHKTKKSRSVLYCDGIGKSGKNALMKVVEVSGTCPQHYYDEPVLEFKKGSGPDNALFFVDWEGRSYTAEECEWIVVDDLTYLGGGGNGVAVSEEPALENNEDEEAESEEPPQEAEEGDNSPGTYEELHQEPKEDVDGDSNGEGGDEDGETDEEDAEEKKNAADALDALAGSASSSNPEDAKKHEHKPKWKPPPRPAPKDNDEEEAKGGNENDESDDDDGRPSVIGSPTNKADGTSASTAGGASSTSIRHGESGVLLFSATVVSLLLLLAVLHRRRRSGKVFCTPSKLSPCAKGGGDVIEGSRMMISSPHHDDSNDQGIFPNVNLNSLNKWNRWDKSPPRSPYGPTFDDDTNASSSAAAHSAARSFVPAYWSAKKTKTTTRVVEGREDDLEADDVLLDLDDDDDDDDAHAELDDVDMSDMAMDALKARMLNLTRSSPGSSASGAAGAGTEGRCSSPDPGETLVRII